MDDIPLLDFSLKKHRDLLIDKINSLRGIHRVEIKRVKNQRSLSQNSYLWGVVYPAILPTLIDASGEDIDSLEVHEMFKAKFLREAMVNKSSGEVIGSLIRSSVDLDVAEFSMFLQKVIEFAYDKLGVVVPPATDYGTQERGTAA